jgi:hypothetical protein
MSDWKLRGVYTGDVGLAISLSDVMEHIFQMVYPFQIYA